MEQNYARVIVEVCRRERERQIPRTQGTSVALYSRNEMVLNLVYLEKFS